MSLQNISDQLLHELGRQIVHGELQPGQSLPKVEDLSLMKGVSRTVVREVLKSLSARRLIESTTKIGTLVCPRSKWQWWDPDVLMWASEMENNHEFLIRLTEVRLAVEPAAMEMAANNATNEDIEHIKKCFIHLSESVNDEEKWVEADYHFHNSLIQASNNELIISLIQTLRLALERSRHKTFHAIKQHPAEPFMAPDEEILERHRAVMQAVCGRKGPLARQKMHDLLNRVSQLIHDKDNKEGKT
ncbi:FadR/GntR family transcriptional regulator [Paenibacillus abyssi]|uniref:GntR family transcriptional regulator n=1 Tax=Paenibacillus abyssi TaxID=1340531 RepID=A0A917FXK6_9BACL|nr:FadR/GntR family transcriptional regulator [Paenibacillus abyssi]GGG11363.1 GntR family transcriptional regulator [Paenibacillus abyssi]